MEYSVRSMVFVHRKKSLSLPPFRPRPRPRSSPDRQSCSSTRTVQKWFPYNTDSSAHTSPNNHHHFSTISSTVIVRTHTPSLPLSTGSQSISITLPLSLVSISASLSFLSLLLRLVPSLPYLTAPHRTAPHHRSSLTPLSEMTLLSV